MKHLDLTFDQPAANLAADEALLEAVEGDGSDRPEGVLRFYEPREYFVVLGYGNRVAAEVQVDACAADGIPVLRRASGGGTVVLGPGCLAYALVLPVSASPELESVTGTNRWILERNRAALGRLLAREVSIQGHTDLTLGDRKFSGNAQRRRRRSVLFHGTLLLDFDLDRLGRWLRMPSAEPAYRGGRGHDRFVTNLEIGADRVKEALREAWGAGDPCRTPLDEPLARLLRERYAVPGWHNRC